MLTKCDNTKYTNDVKYNPLVLSHVYRYNIPIVIVVFKNPQATIAV